MSNCRYIPRFKNSIPPKIKIYEVYGYSMHRTVYTLGFYQSRKSAETVLNKAMQTVSKEFRISYGINEHEVKP